MVQIPSFTKVPSVAHQDTLVRACEWLSIDLGRARQYCDLLKEYIEGAEKSREHILAINESFEIIDLFNLWEQRISDFPGLENKIRAIFKKGPTLREYERPAVSSNRPRNDAFACLVAGHLLREGVPVIAVEGILARDAECDSEADITFTSRDGFVDVECKRPQSDAALVRRTKEAHDQITRPSRGGRLGIVALDCSVLVRPPDTVLKSVSPASGESVISQQLENTLSPSVVSHLTDSILGLLLFARVPAMTPLEIVAPGGESIFRPDCIVSWLVVGNSIYAGNPCHDVLRRLSNSESGLARAT